MCGSGFMSGFATLPLTTRHVANYDQNYVKLYGLSIFPNSVVLK